MLCNNQSQGGDWWQTGWPLVCISDTFESIDFCFNFVNNNRLDISFHNQNMVPLRRIKTLLRTSHGEVLGSGCVDNYVRTYSCATSWNNLQGLICKGAKFVRGVKRSDLFYLSLISCLIFICSSNTN